jgi:L-xylulokinase
MKQYVMVIDRGSTNVKVVIFDQQGDEILTSTYASQKPVSYSAGWWEQDMNFIWESTLNAIKGAFASQKVTPDDIAGVFVTGQGNGLMPIDKNGEPARMGILSLDSRASQLFNQWNQDGRYAKAIQTLGMPFVVGSPVPLLAWLKENNKEEFDRIDKILFSKDWIRYKLCGVACSDYTDVSGAGMMDVKTGEYAYDVFSMFGLDDIKEKLPEIRRSHEIVGEVTQKASYETGLKVGTKVLCGAQDTCAYPYGIGTLSGKELVSVVGTWGMNITTTQDISNTMVAIYHSVPDYFITGFGDGNSGGCLDIFVNNLCQEEKLEAAQTGKNVYQLIEEKISNIKPTGIIFEPFVFGSLFNNYESGGFYGIKNWHTKADLLRAIYEGIVMGHCMYIKAIPNNEKFEAIWLIGGGAKGNIFGQLFADILNVPVRIAQTSEITARGGALNAFVGLGVYKNHQEACIPPKVKKEFLPDAQRHAFYADKFNLFCKIREANQALWPEIDAMNRKNM